jgi:hypothetical protein
VEAEALVLGHTHAPMGIDCDAATGAFEPLEDERATFGVLELPSLRFRVHRADDGAEVEVPRRRF